MKRKALLVTVLFLLIFNLNKPKVVALGCTGVSYTTDPPLYVDGKSNIHPNTGHIKVVVTADNDCFKPGLEYSFRYWKDSGRIDVDGWGDVKKAIDPKTFQIEWDLTRESAKVGKWNFILWLGRGTANINADNTILNFQYEITFLQGNPSIKPEHSSYQVGTKPKFNVENAESGQDYTFWWDGDATARKRYKANSTSFFVEVDPVNQPITDKKFCMAVGNFWLFTPECQFSTLVSFTSGPPPDDGGPVELKQFDPCYDKASNTYNQSCVSCLGERTDEAKAYGDDNRRKKEADNSWTGVGCVPNKPEEFVGWLLARAVGIGGGIAFLIMLWGGFQLMTSSGDPQKLNNGKETITSAAIGLLFIIFSVVLMKIIGVDILALPGFNP